MRRSDWYLSGRNNLQSEPGRFRAWAKQRRVGVERGREVGSHKLTAESVLSQGKPPASLSPVVTSSLISNQPAPLFKTRQGEGPVHESIFDHALLT